VTPDGQGRSGILFVDKPKGFTSHDVVARIRKLVGTRKVGHAGTLDPMATGLLIVGLNSATRLLTFLVGLDKEYLATIRLGQSTTTDDAEGEQLSETDASSIDAAAISRAVSSLTGSISQVPSTVSAIKVDGKRAYARARAGETVALAAREVTISEFEVIGLSTGSVADLNVRVVCSSGTYVRALARDLGANLGVGGHLTALRRTRIGPFVIENALALDDLTVETALVSPADVAAKIFPTFRMDEQQAVDLACGKRVVAEGDGTVAAIGPDGRLVGLATIETGMAQPIINFPADGPGR
jgi:tRNA pseudouridine55 synthase